VKIFFCTRKSTIEIVNNFHMLENLCPNSGGVLFLKFFLNFKKRMLMSECFIVSEGHRTNDWFMPWVWGSCVGELEA